MARRRAEALVLYEPMPSQESFHACKTLEVIVRGSNRSGKSLCAMIEVARAVSGCDPHNKYPLKDGVCVLVGFDGKHLGQVFFKYLMRAGSFKIIRDPRTGLWRAFHPITDIRLKHLAKPAPPLIPPRMVREIAWEDKKARIPKVIRLVNGWEIHFISGNAEFPKGWQVDLGVFDEEIGNDEFYPEMSARLLDRRGRFIWAATPEVATESLYRLHERAEKEPNAVAEFHLLLDDNMHVGVEEKRAFFDKLTEEQRRVKYFGEYAKLAYRVYPEFSENVHCVQAFPIPADWCRYLVIDPGRQVCAVLFGAVPPDGKHVYLYDELYIRGCTAEILANELRHKTESQCIQACLIDSRAGRATQIGAGMTVEYQYSLELRKKGVSFVIGGHGFIWASDDVKGGIQASRSWLHVRGGGDQNYGTSKLQVFHEKCPNLVHEFRHYHYRRKPDGELTDDPVQKNNHLMDCLRYLAMFNPRYVLPKASRQQKGYVIKILEARAKARREKFGDQGVRLGPGFRRRF